MAYINMGNLYDYIHETLRTDEIILSLMGLEGETDMKVFAERIQKRRQPNRVTETLNFPVISFYANPGTRDYNHLEYLMAFDFDIYTGDDPEAAMTISDRISEIFDDKYVGIKCGSQFKAEWLTASEDDTTIENTYKFFTRILFTLGIEG